MLDKAQVRTLRNKLQDQLADFGDDYQVKVGNASFSDNNVTFKVTVSVVGDDGKVITQEAEDFQHYAAHWGLKAEDLGRKFKQWNGDVFEIVKNRQANIQIRKENSNGSQDQSGRRC